MKNILITGANRGIGLEMTRQLLQRGERVIATCRQPAKADTLQALDEQFPEQLTILPIEVTNPVSIQAAFNASQRIVTHLDVLINNAGILNRHETLATFDPEVMQGTFDVNATGSMRVVTQFLPLLRKAEHAKIINITSQLGSLQAMRGKWGRYSYNSSKAALNMLTRMLAFDLKDEDIAVICVHPGWVQTDMGGTAADITAVESASGILTVIDNLTLAQTGQFYTYAGDEHLW
ncbi:MAG: SDR family oxidoreductase [Anaerolineae bacterium]|nr:SDR family oxidoreductase [Anaerolineae bacterium]